MKTVRSSSQRSRRRPMGDSTINYADGSSIYTGDDGTMTYTTADGSSEVITEQQYEAIDASETSQAGATSSIPSQATPATVNPTVGVPTNVGSGLSSLLSSVGLSSQQSGALLSTFGITTTGTAVARPRSMALAGVSSTTWIAMAVLGGAGYYLLSKQKKSAAA